jgi:hypothetical protein
MNIKEKITKKNIVTTFLIILLVLSVSYVARDMAIKYQNTVLWQGYQSAVRDLVIQAKNEECQPVPLLFNDEEVTVINIECLQQQPAEDLPEEETTEE